MGRRGRSFFGVFILSAGAVAVYLWRTKRVREGMQALLSPAADRVKGFLRRRLRRQATCEPEEAEDSPEIVATGLGAPECRPLSTPRALLAWSPATDPDAPFCRTYNAPLPAPPPHTHSLGHGHAAPRAAAALSPAADPRPPPRGPAPRLLVCHDMMGGYLGDRLVQGADDPGFYRIWQWDQIDMFIYFSHHLVTLPPPGWTAAAHRNGVPVLGTFITEWEEGGRRCARMLADRATAQATAERLAALAAHHGFEGWLVNIENPLPREAVPLLQHFVAHLRAALRAAVGERAVVVWYDAVTTEGRLAWQDGLTPLNSPFFDAADALFVNYRWREGAPGAVAAAAGWRAEEVFMGVDVFGRGTYGGGQDNCPVALAAARAAGVSAALFAPGWVYENHEKAGFEARQEAFWAAIRAVWPPARPAQLTALPFASSFATGCGRGVWLEGRAVSGAPWWQLAAQDLVPACSALTEGAGAGAGAGEEAVPRPPSRALRVRHTQQLAFAGGSCLALTAPAAASAAAAEPDPWVHQLHTAHVPVPAAGLDLSYTVACSGTSRVAVLLRVEVEASGGGGGGGTGGGAAVCGVAVGPWTAGDNSDKAAVEALRRQGYTCLACHSAPTGAVTCPLPEPAPSAAATAAPAVAPAVAPPAPPTGVPWVTCSAHLPYSLVPGRGLITAVGLVCWNTSAVSAAAAAAATAAPATAGGGGGGRGSLRGSATGYAAGAAGAAAAPRGAGAPPAEPQAFAAYLGRLSLREHRPTGPSPPAAPTAGPLGLPSLAPAPPCAPSPLSGFRCSRVRWSRPGQSPASLRTVSRTASGSGGAAASAAAVAAEMAGAVAGTLLAAGPRSSGELVDAEMSWEDEETEQSVGGNGGASDVPEELAAYGGGDCGARLLTCELSWAPQFEAGGLPRHRSYHVWAHFEGTSPPPHQQQLPSPTPPAAAAAAAGGAGSWEVLSPEWGGAVWAGEAHVATYRLVQLEVPAGAAGVTLLVQGVGAAAGEPGPLQPAARLAVP